VGLLRQGRVVVRREHLTMEVIVVTQLRILNLKIELCPIISDHAVSTTEPGNLAVKSCNKQVNTGLYFMMIILSSTLLVELIRPGSTMCI